MEINALPEPLRRFVRDLAARVSELEAELHIARTRPAAATPATATPVPQGAAAQLYVVIRLGGERHYLDRETEAEIRAWAKGMDVTVLGYRFESIIHRPPPKVQPPPSKPDAAKKP